MIKFIGFLFLFNIAFADDFKLLLTNLNLNDIEYDPQVYTEDLAPIVSPIKSIWKRPPTKEYQNLADIAKKHAKVYVSKFFDPDYRTASSTNREMFELGRRRFRRHYRKSGKYFKGYVLGAKGEHILSGTDCTRFLHKVWDHIIKINFAKPNVTFPYTVTLILHDIAKAWELTYKNASPKTEPRALKEMAYERYKKLLTLKWRKLNKEARENRLPQLPKKWIDINLKKFPYYELVPNFEDAIAGDIVLKILNHTRHLERGHAYMFLEKSGDMAGIGAQSGITGLAYNKHFSHKSRYILRPNLDYIRNL